MKKVSRIGNAFFKLLERCGFLKKTFTLAQVAPLYLLLLVFVFTELAVFSGENLDSIWFKGVLAFLLAFHVIWLAQILFHRGAFKEVRKD